MTTAKTRFLLVASCLFTAVVLCVVVVGAYFQTETRIAWCLQRGYDYEHQTWHVGKLIEGRIVCLDDKRRVLVIPE